MKKKTELEDNPMESAGIWSKLTFAWLLPIFVKGLRRPIEKEDLFKLSKEDSSVDLGDQIFKNWDSEIAAAKGAKRKPSYIRALFRTFGFSYCVVGILACIEECILRIGQPLCLGVLIRHFHGYEGYGDDYVGILSAVGIMLGSLLYIGTHHPFFWGIQLAGMKMRVASCSLLYRKALRLSSTALGQTTVGQMVNLLSNDVNRFDTSVIFLHYLWIGPLQTFIVTVILWQELGPSCLAGIVLLILFVPLQSYLGRVFSRLRLATAHRTDERIRIMNEIVNAMRVIKMYAWEKPFTALIKEARRKEINVIMKTNYYRALNMSMFFTSNKIIVFLALLVYVLTGNALTAEKVFVTASLISNVRLTMTLFFPFGIAMGSETFISCKRIQRFLEMEEREDSSRIEKVNLRPKPRDCSVEAKNLCARWVLTSSDDDLKDISFKVLAGELLAVVGSVGAGKSSLLQTLLSELPIKKGSIQINGKLAYVSQEPWLFAGTVKQNILFGQPFDAKKYHQVLRVCALERDLEILPERDQTMVGERGVALSGGQKARINLARAVYFDADIYLLDDPLSAVDTHVGKHLYEECISKFLSHKVRILVTHQLQYLKTANQILVLHNGYTQSHGTYNQLTAQGIDFESLIGEKKEAEPEEIIPTFEHPKASLIRQRTFRRESDDTAHLSRIARFRRDSEAWHSLHGSNTTLHESGVEGNSIMDMAVVGVGGRGSIVGLGCNVEDEEEEEEPVAKLDEQSEEVKATGTVSLSIYGAYFKAGGGILFLTVLFILTIVTQVLFTGSDYWLSYWTNAEQKHGTETYDLFLETTAGTLTNSTIDDAITPFDRDVYVYVYAGVTVALFVLSFIRTIMFFVLCMVASKTLHLKMFTAIIQAPIKFFDTHPIGQILNRFTKDLGQLDDLLPPTLFDFISILLTFVGIIVIVASVNVWILLPTILLAGVFFLLRMVYLASARDIKRLEGITRSPVFSHLSSSLHGLTTIRALGAQEAFIRDFDDHQDLHSSAWFLFLCTTRCFGIWLDFLACIYITIVTFSFLGRTDEVMGGDVGLAISNAMMLSGMFQWGVRQSAEVENQMTSVERVLEYSKLKPESPNDKEKGKKKPGWPAGGKLSFQNVSLYYDEYSPPVLKKVNFDIEAGQKVGIVGRTGAGKSSLLTCLFRLTQPKGTILIDDVDTDTIPLSDLRESISIIPQDPTLFNGTVRENLDPFVKHTDEEIWNALEEVQLKQPVSEMSGGLSAFVSEGGHNLSIGQRQLVCLARAILKHNKILVMDEATANVDPQTDNGIQQTIRLKFVDCTVLTIAHRLHTIMDSDKVLVMEAGEVEEFASPHELLQDSNTIFSQLLRQTGQATEQHLRKVAEEAFYSRLVSQKKQIGPSLSLHSMENNNFESYDSKANNNYLTNDLIIEMIDKEDEMIKEENSFNKILEPRSLTLEPRPLPEPTFIISRSEVNPRRSQSKSTSREGSTAVSSDDTGDSTKPLEVTVVPSSSSSDDENTKL